MKTRTSRPGVTLIEMLVVLTILIILFAIIARVWKGLEVQTQEKALENTFTILDTALAEYQEAKGRFPAPDADANEVKVRNAFLCQVLLEEPQSRVIMESLTSGPRGALRRIPKTEPARLYDPWDGLLDYTYTTGDTFFLLRSAGPDRSYQTKDDITHR